MFHAVVHFQEIKKATLPSGVPRMQAEFLSVADESPKTRPLSLLGVDKNNMTKEIEEYAKMSYILQLESTMRLPYKTRQSTVNGQMGALVYTYLPRQCNLRYSFETIKYM
jgi:hypothetical protein